MGSRRAGPHADLANLFHSQEVTMEISGSTALVTGANRGIGRALVEELLAAGAAKVYAAARNPDSVKDLAGQYSRVVPIALDLTNHEQIAQAAEDAADVTLLVNNGGSLNFADPLSGDLDAIHTDVVTNLVGPLVVTRQFVPVLERNGGGAIVNLLSLVVFGSVPA